MALEPRRVGRVRPVGLGAFGRHGRCERIRELPGTREAIGRQLRERFRHACSTPAGTISRTVCSAVGRSVSTFATIAWTVDPVNGGSPASISYVTAPNA